jgi:hypothetical protein
VGPSSSVCSNGLGNLSTGRVGIPNHGSLIANGPRTQPSRGGGCSADAPGRPWHGLSIALPPIRPGIGTDGMRGRGLRYAALNQTQQRKLWPTAKQRQKPTLWPHSWGSFFVSALALAGGIAFCAAPQLGQAWLIDQKRWRAPCLWSLAVLPAYWITSSAVARAQPRSVDHRYQSSR